MIENLKTNIEEIKKLSERIIFLNNQFSVVKTAAEQKTIGSAMNSTINQIKILNEAIPNLVKNISIAKKLPSQSKKKIKSQKDVISVKYKTEGGEKFIALNKKDKERYLKELSIFDYSLNQLKKRKIIKKKPGAEFKKPSMYAKISNKFFSGLSNSLIKKGYFKDLALDLRKAELNVTLNTYISIVFFSVLLSFFVGIGLFLFFLFLNVNPLATPIISQVPAAEILTRFLQVIWFIPGLPIATFLTGYFYPSTEKDSLAKKINYEIPFVTIQMSAVASSGVEPSQIFKIIALSKEYPAIRKEAKKIMNQINLYGYNLVNALRNVSFATPSKKFAELLNGFSTSITSGGSLTSFLNKRAETLLFEYKIEMEKYTKSAEAFMDIYISVVIAAPMMMMLILIIMSMTQMGLGLGIGTLTLIIVMIVAVINLILLTFLHLNQRKF